MKRKRVDVNLKELDQIIDHAREVSAERIGKREAERSIARAGGHAACTTLYGEDQRGASARRSATTAEQRKASQATGATELLLTPARTKSRCLIPRLKPAIMPGLPKRAKCTRCLVQTESRGHW